MSSVRLRSLDMFDCKTFYDTTAVCFEAPMSSRSEGSGIVCSFIHDGGFAQIRFLWRCGERNTMSVPPCGSF